MHQPDRRFAFVLALRLGCTVDELGERISAEEFGEWKAFFSKEQLHPAAARMRHAQLMAALHNGALVKRDKTTWTSAQFMSADPWVIEEETAEAAAPTPAQIAAEVARINASFES
ncbi:MAG: hypothetical protein Q8S12_00350 [Hydrogenophaga sp.]|uniref:phage tail assembly protein T n=1 Tax=Hydrogenophaga sp. TaxID=1904254 RepID=UPI002737301C|nr:hypothetical protein [Hydrogenophaga sp.]MDP3625016.1 hypothetical protein [Hydrogenophaga sp.]